MDPKIAVSSMQDRFASASVVVFDAPGVLFDESMWNRWLLRLLHRVGLQTDFQVFFRVWDEEYQAEIAAGRIEYWTALRQYLRETGLRAGCIDELIVAGRSRKSGIQRPTCPLNGVQQAVLELFGRGFQLAAIGDNADAVCLAKLLSDWRLENYFNYIEESCRDKQDRNTCLELLNRFADPSEILVISNHIWMLRQATRAGLRTLSIAEPGVGADRQITDIRLLGKTLQCSHSRRAAG